MPFLPDALFCMVRPLCRHLPEMSEGSVKAPNRREAAALAAGAAEIHRDDWWAMLPLRDRERAVGVAGMPRERAAMPLATFNDQDRERVRLALAVHIGNMELIARCMAASNTNVQGWLH